MTRVTVSREELRRVFVLWLTGDESTPEERAVFDALPVEERAMIYTEWMYHEFELIEETR